jgi:hypothetical protein
LSQSEQEVIRAVGTSLLFVSPLLFEKPMLAVRAISAHDRAMTTARRTGRRSPRLPGHFEKERDPRTWLNHEVSQDDNSRLGALRRSVVDHGRR